MNTEELKKALRKLHYVVPKKSTYPMLKNLRFTGDGKKLSITANNMACSLTYIIEDDTLCSDCVPEKTLYDLISIVKSDKINMKFNNDKVVIKKYPGRSTLKTVSAEQFPLSIEAHGDNLTINREEFSFMLSACVMNVDPVVEARPSVAGVNIRSDYKNLMMAGTDGFRFTLIKRDGFGTEKDFNVTVPFLSAVILNKILSDEEIEIIASEYSMTVKSKSFIFTTQLNSSKYPNMNSFIPTKWNTSLTLDKASMVEAIKPALILAKDHSGVIHVALKGDRIELSGETKNGDTSVMEVMPVEFAGDTDFTIHINGQFLSDYLTIVKDRFIMKINNGISPVGLFIPGIDYLSSIIMPVKI